ncbi:MAG: COX15/CtaA family protein, partial [Planctomycetota bacterium]
MSTNTPLRSLLAPAAVFAFGVAVAMWIVGFITHLPGLQAPPLAVGIALLVTQLAGAILCGRVCGPRPVLTGALAGLGAGLINLMILGAVVTSGSEEFASLPVLLVGWVLFSTALGTIGAAIGARFPGSTKELRPAGVWLAAFGAVAIAAAVPVLLSGGLTTSKDAGLAVPDWPTSYGANMFLFPLAKMTGGIYYEHTHRLFGSLIGLTTIALVVFTFLADKRLLARASATTCLVFVVAQGILGGVGVAIADDTTQWRESIATPEEVPDEVATNYALTTDNRGSAGMRMVHGV